MDKKLLYRIDSLVHFLLLNACALPSSGLYQGKVGLALVLFEASKTLNNEEYENQAADLLQEALLTKTDDVSFEKGLSGIGFVLRYLILERYIDADYEELFGNQICHIIKKTHASLNENMQRLDVCILFDLLGIKSKLITEIFKNRDLYYESLFLKMAENPLGNFPVEVIQKQWQEDLYIACSCREYKAFGKAINAYNRLYRKNMLGRNPIIGYYLVQLGQCMKSDEVIMLGREFWSAHPFLLEKKSMGLLHEHLQKEFMAMHFSEISKQIYKDFFDFFVDCDDETLEYRLRSMLPSGVAGVGLKYGIARLIMQMCWICQNECSVNAMRMYNTILS